MPGSKTNYTEQKVIEYLLGNISFTPPSTYYIGLWTIALSNSSTGSTTNEVNGGDYARVSISNNTLNFGNTGEDGVGIRKNKAEITFPTATTTWGNVYSVGICDALTGGNMLFFYNFDDPVSINTGNTVKIAINDLVVTED